MNLDTQALDKWADALHAALVDVKAERLRQRGKWGLQRHQPSIWLAILTEEVGEMSEEILNANTPRLRAEALQVAAVALAIVQWCDNGEA